MSQEIGSDSGTLNFFMSPIQGHKPPQFGPSASPTIWVISTTHNQSQKHPQYKLSA